MTRYKGPSTSTHVRRGNLPCVREVERRSWCHGIYVVRPGPLQTQIRDEFPYSEWLRKVLQNRHSQAKEWTEKEILVYRRQDLNLLDNDPHFTSYSVHKLICFTRYTDCSSFVGRFSVSFSYLGLYKFVYLFPYRYLQLTSISRQQSRYRLLRHQIYFDNHNWWMTKVLNFEH